MAKPSKSTRPIDHVGRRFALHARRGVVQLQPPQGGGADALDAVLRRRPARGGGQPHVVSNSPAHLQGRMLQEELRVT